MFGVASRNGFMPARIAFTAGLWGDAAVVCRAVEGRPGPVVDPQFGLFDTWTHANDFASSLNQGLEIDALEARQIVTSAILATSDVLRITGYPEIAYSDAPVLIAANALQVRFLQAELTLALTFCRMARTLGPEAGTDRILRNAHSAALLAVTSIFQLKTDQAELEEIAAKLDLLREELQESSSDCRCSANNLSV